MKNNLKVEDIVRHSKKLEVTFYYSRKQRRLTISEHCTVLTLCQEKLGVMQRKLHMKNFVNCWKTLTINKARAISSQAMQRCMEGSTTRASKLAWKSVKKLHEREAPI